MKYFNNLLYTILVVFCVVFTACDFNEETSLRSLPTAAFEVDNDLIKLEQSIQLTDMSFDQNDEVVAWNWDLGNGVTSTEQSFSYVYPAVGDYTITLSVTDSEGNVSDNIFTEKVTVYTTSGTEPTRLWNYELPYYSTHSSLAEFNDNIFVVTDGKTSEPGRGDNVFAVNNGTLLWSDVTDEVMRMTPAVAADGTVYAADYSGLFNAYNQDGSIKWSVDLGKRVKYGSPAIASDGTIYIGMEDDKKFFALNPEDGSVVWTFAVDNDVRATPVIDSNGIIYVASSDDYFYAINPDGTLKWKTIYGDYTTGAPAISEQNNTVYLTGKSTDNAGHLIAFDMNDGTIKWDNVREDAKMEEGGPVVATDGTIYAGGNDGKMMAYTPDGAIKWEYATIGAEATILSAPALDQDGNLYFGDSDGYFYVVGADGQNEWAPIQLDDNIRSSALISKTGTVYVLTRTDHKDEEDNDIRKGHIHALQTDATGLMENAWPMLSNNAAHTGNIND